MFKDCFREGLNLFYLWNKNKFPPRLMEIWMFAAHWKKLIIGKIGCELMGDLVKKCYHFKPAFGKLHSLSGRRLIRFVNDYDIATHTTHVTFLFTIWPAKSCIAY